MTRTASVTAETVVMTSRINESYLACAMKAARPDPRHTRMNASDVDVGSKCQTRVSHPPPLPCMQGSAMHKHACLACIIALDNKNSQAEKPRIEAIQQLESSWHLLLEEQGFNREAVYQQQ